MTKYKLDKILVITYKKDFKKKFIPCNYLSHCPTGFLEVHGEEGTPFLGINKEDLHDWSIYVPSELENLYNAVEALNYLLKTYKE